MGDFPPISTLIPDLRAGDNESWNRVVEKFRPALVSRARYLLANSKLKQRLDADDLVNLTFEKAWKNHQQLLGESTKQVAGWFLRIQKNAFIDQCRPQHREESHSSWYAFAANSSTGSKRVLREEQEHALHACLTEIKPEYVEVVSMRHFEGLKYREIAETLGVTEGTIVGRHRQGLKELEALLHARGFTGSTLR